jgi:hypothetical protein
VKLFHLSCDRIITKIVSDHTIAAACRR